MDELRQKQQRIKRRSSVFFVFFYHSELCPSYLLWAIVQSATELYNEEVFPHRVVSVPENGTCSWQLASGANADNNKHAVCRMPAHDHNPPGNSSLSMSAIGYV